MYNNKNKKGNMTLDQIQKWIQTAKKGEKVTYYKGFLMKDSDGNINLKRIIYFLNEMCSTFKKQKLNPVIDVVHKKISGIRSHPEKSDMAHPADKKNPVVYEYIIQKR